MKKSFTINDRTIPVQVVQVFDKDKGHINEHILAVDVSGVEYNADIINQLIDQIKKEFPQLKAIYYDISGDNYNNMYACIIRESKILQLNAGKVDYEKYCLTISDLAPRYN